MNLKLNKKVSIVLIFLLNLTVVFSQDNFIAKILTDGKGRFLEGENIDLVHPIASLTKIMTVVVAIDEVNSGRISYDDTVRISKTSARIGGSSSQLRWGEYISFYDLLKAVIVQSGNDSAHAVAEYVAGTEDEFVKMMNEKAQELGLENTKYYTSTGLPPSMTGKELDVSTAKDMAKLSSEVLNNYEKHMEYSGLDSITIGDKFVKTFENRNKFIGRYEGVTGLKTGHHSAAGYCFSITASRDNRDFILVVLGYPTERERDIQVERILDSAFQNYERRQITAENEFAMKIPIRNAIEKEIDLVVKRDVYGLVNTTQDWDFRKIAYLPNEVVAPLEAGEIVGKLTIKYKDQIIDEVELITGNSVEEIPWYWRIIRVMTFNIL